MKKKINEIRMITYKNIISINLLFLIFSNLSYSLSESNDFIKLEKMTVGPNDNYQGNLSYDRKFLVYTKNIKQVYNIITSLTHLWRFVLWCVGYCSYVPK